MAADRPGLDDGPLPSQVEETRATPAQADPAQVAPANPRTHTAMNRALSGSPRILQEGRAVLHLETTEEMRADHYGLVHGGFVFSLADHAAMLAIDHPNVVLGSAQIRFHQPVSVGEMLEAEAKLAAVEGKKHRVEVVVRRLRPERSTISEGAAQQSTDDRAVFEGEFICFVPARHVLENRGSLREKGRV